MIDDRTDELERVAADRPRADTDRSIVLIVDDDPGIRTMLGIALSSEGYDTVAASNRAETLAALSDVAVDVILLDLRLGAESGPALARDLRAGTGLPILIMSAGDRPADLDRTVADAWLAKPFALEALFAEIETLLRTSLHRGAAGT